MIDVPLSLIPAVASFEVTAIAEVTTEQHIVNETTYDMIVQAHNAERFAGRLEDHATWPRPSTPGSAPNPFVSCWA